ncbi:hypothetical protein L6452_05335 [Arctium lappa]|uniref:Uncharacterized protein n=1 Tax=Arctium lappa TaxID=4217 RepID=A0ACB9EG40_ARCLA|nr:hypothetical protein L6452_05335 [Arctium lappa]
MIQVTTPTKHFTMIKIEMRIKAIPSSETGRNFPLAHMDYPNHPSQSHPHPSTKHIFFQTSSSRSILSNLFIS